MEGGPTVAQLFTHVHYVRLVFVAENASERAVAEPAEEWAQEDDPERIAQLLNESARVVREAVVGRLGAGRDMDRHFDHPILLIQMMIWHEGTITARSSSRSRLPASRSRTRSRGR